MHQTAAARQSLPHHLPEKGCACCPASRALGLHGCDQAAPSPGGLTCDSSPFDPGAPAEPQPLHDRTLASTFACRCSGRRRASAGSPRAVCPLCLPASPCQQAGQSEAKQLNRTGRRQRKTCMWQQACAVPLREGGAAAVGLRGGPGAQELTCHCCPPAGGARRRRCLRSRPLPRPLQPSVLQAAAAGS